MFYQTYQLYMGGREVTRGRREKGEHEPGRPPGRANRLPEHSVDTVLREISKNDKYRFGEYWFYPNCFYQLDPFPLI